MVRLICITLSYAPSVYLLFHAMLWK